MMIGKKICICVSLLLLLSSCDVQKRRVKSRPIRIVDSEGNPALLERKTPKFNKEQITKQKMSDSNIRIMNGNSDYNQNNLPNDLFADKTDDNTKVKYDTQKKGSEDKIIFKTTEQERKLKQKLVQKKEEKNTKVKTQKQTTTKKASSKKVVATAPIVKKRKSNKTRKSSDRGTFYIQIGAYRKKVNANKSLNKYSSIGRGIVKSYKNKNGVMIYRTVLGPYSSKSQAERDLDKVVQRGHYDVYITRK